MSKKKFKEKKEQKSKKEKGGLYGSLISLLDEMSGKAYTAQQIAKKLQLKKKALIEDLYKILDSLMEEGKIEQLSNGAYKLKGTKSGAKV